MTTKKRKVDKVNSDDSSPDSSPDNLLLSVQAKEKLKNEHYINTFFDKIELFILRICYDDDNRIDKIDLRTDWDKYFSEFKKKIGIKIF